MRPTSFAMVSYLVAMLGVSAFLSARGEDPPSNSTGVAFNELYGELRNAVPKAYGQEAVRLMIEDANSVANQLNLGEKLPIEKKDLAEVYVSPPRLSNGTALGTVATSKYRYCVSIDNKLCFILKHLPDEEVKELIVKYSRPLGTHDTNAAFAMACHYLKAAQMDVEALVE